MTRRSDAPGAEAGGDTLSQPQDNTPDWLGQDRDAALGAWFASTDFADAGVEYQRLGILAEIDQQAQWDREAAEVRAYALTITPVPPDPVATQLVRDMNRLEDEGKVVWNDWARTWERPRRRFTPRSDYRALTADQLLTRFDRVRPVRGGWTARCPAHDDQHPSLSIKQGRSWWLLWCFAGCSTRAVCAAVGLTVPDLALDGHDG